MIIFFSIPLWLIAFWVLGAIAIASELISWIVFAIYICMVLFLWGFYLIPLWGRSKNIPVGTTILSIIGTACMCFSAYIFSRKGAHISGFMAVMIFAAIVCAISYLLALPKSVFLRALSGLLLVIEIIMITMWSVGYDINRTLRIDYRNIAYFECVAIKKKGWGSTGKIYDSLKSSRKAIGSFEIGDKFSPYPQDFPSIYNPTQGIKYYDDNLWPIDYHGSIAYIPSVNFEPRYWEHSDFTEKTRSSVIGWKHYTHLPDTFLQACESLFIKFPYGFSFVLVPS